jgi:hypothetical protein
LLTLQDTNGFDVVGEPGYRFATQRFTQMEQGYAYPGNPYALSVTSESEEYPYNSPATFTYNVFNHSDVTQTFEVRWYMIHHSWYNVPGYNGSATVTVGPHSMNSVASARDVSLISIECGPACTSTGGRSSTPSAASG